jgi:chromosome segregation ATPase
VEESALKRVIVRALNKFNANDRATYLTLMKATIGDAIGLNGGSDEIDLLERRIDALNKRMIALVNESVQNGDDIESHEDEFKSISEETDQLKKRIEAIRESEAKDESYADRLKTIQNTIDQREMNRDVYDDTIVRQMVECIKVFKDKRIVIIFGGGYEIEETLE